MFVFCIFFSLSRRLALGIAFNPGVTQVGTLALLRSAEVGQFSSKVLHDMPFQATIVILAYDVLRL